MRQVRSGPSLAGLQLPPANFLPSAVRGRAFRRPIGGQGRTGEGRDEPDAGSGVRVLSCNTSEPDREGERPRKSTGDVSLLAAPGPIRWRLLVRLAAPTQCARCASVGDAMVSREGIEWTGSRCIPTRPGWCSSEDRNGSCLTSCPFAVSVDRRSHRRRSKPWYHGASHGEAEMTEIHIGDIIGARYRVEAVIGQGGMAVVYRATHTGTDEACALKVISPHLAQRPGVLQLFAKEARMGGKIGWHPHIVHVYDAGIDERSGLPFLAMELLQGETLQQRIERGPVERELVVELVEQLADALQVAHEASVVHRDLKPSNLFVTRDRKGRAQLKVLDFGIAKVLEGEMHKTATEIGTPAYAAPEQLGPSFRDIAKNQGVTVADEVSPATDIWALGLIVYEALTGHGPGQYWGASTETDRALRMALALRNAPRASERAGDRAQLLPGGFDEWFGRCTRMDARERWGGAQQAWEALKGLIVATGGKEQPWKGEPKVAAQTSVAGMMGTFAPGAKVAAEQPAPVQEAGAVASVPGPPRTQLAGVVATMPGPSAGAVEDGKREKKGSGYKWLAIPGGLFVAGIVAMVVSTGKKSTDDAGAKPQEAVLPPPACPAGMVAIPGGTFMMGSSSGEDAEKPVHRVELDGFCMDVTEVTVEAYAQCVSAGSCTKPDTGEGCNWGQSGKGNHPINCVDWYQAEAYCTWVGKRLPTEQEWEYGARGGSRQLEYPWGSEAPGSRACWNRSDGTCPVGSYPSGDSPFGLHDMAGNVWEWVQDWYGPYPTSVSKNYAGHSSGLFRVIRGGGWGNNDPSLLRGSRRYLLTPDDRGYALGIRCARTR